MKQPDEDIKMKHKKNCDMQASYVESCGCLLLSEKITLSFIRNSIESFICTLLIKWLTMRTKVLLRGSYIGYFCDKLTVELPSWRLLGKVILISLYRHFCWSFFYIYYTTHLLLPVHHIIYFIIP